MHLVKSVFVCLTVHFFFGHIAFFAQQIQLLHRKMLFSILTEAEQGTYIDGGTRKG